VSAVTAVDAVEITRPALEAIFARSPELMDAFAANLARRQAQLNQFAFENTKVSVLVAQIRSLFGTAATPKPLRKT
jgi:CRP-like cAMP-binding protein